MKKLGLLLVSCACSLFIWQNAGAAPAAGKAVAAKKKVQLLGFEPKSCKKIIVQGDSVTVCVETSKPDVVLDREAKYQIQRAASLLAEMATGKGTQKIISNDGLSFSCADDPNNSTNPPPPDPCQDSSAMMNPACPQYQQYQCMMNPGPGCPGYNPPPPPDPCQDSSAMMNPACPQYQQYQCMMNPGPGCPGYNPPPPPDPCQSSSAMMNPACPQYQQYQCMMNPGPGCPGY